jgi:hypothetical protein
VRSESEHGDSAATVRGRHYTAWLPAVEELTALHTDAADRAALDLIDAVLDAVEAEAVRTGTRPPTAWYERAAALHRRRGDVPAEVAVLRRCAHWAGPAVPPGLDARLLTAEATLRDPDAVGAVLDEADSRRRTG